MGQIQDDGERVRIKVNYGEIAVSKREIKEVAGSPLELYARQRDRLPPGEADAHLELAVWCLEHGLKQEARQELELARSLHPDHPMIGLAARRIELSNSAVAGLPHGQQQAKTPHAEGGDRTSASAMNRLPLPSWLSGAPRVGSPGNGAMPAGQHVTLDTAPLSVKITDVPDVTAAPLRRSDPSALLRGLPANTGSDFVRVIQPILSNQCATAGCHGVNAPGDRRLFRIPFGRPATRSETAHNLEIVLGWIDFQDPGASPLLAAPTRPHGGTAAPIFSGNSARQYRELVNWVFSVTRKDGGESQRPAPSDSSAEMPGGIPPELLQADSPSLAVEAPDGVVEASAMQSTDAVVPAVAWAAEDGPAQPLSAGNEQRFFPEWFSEKAEGEHSITLESGRILPSFPESDACATCEGKAASSTRSPVRRMPQGTSTSMNSQEAPVIEATGVSDNTIPGDGAKPPVATDESAVQGASERPAPKVLPFGDHLPPQSNLIYR